ncbi:MAG: hypothetical protein GXO64_03790, partial [Candidatus Micrarchaeota archaeon]|nr:hypothetical protein [Candidatus Micrarchaeota archaeon]
MRFSSVLSHAGIAMKLMGYVAIIPIFVSLLLGDGAYVSFMTAAIIFFVLGTVLDKRYEKTKIRMESAMLISAFTIIMVSLIGSIPYMFYMAPVDAIFESVSGFTTTGLSVVEPEILPLSILLWRSMTQWMGGLGILVMVLLLLGS